MEMPLAGIGNTEEGLCGASKMVDMNTEHAVLVSYARERVDNKLQGGLALQRGAGRGGVGAMGETSSLLWDPLGRDSRKREAREEWGILSLNREKEEREAAKETGNPCGEEEGVRTSQCIKQSA